MFHIPAQHCPDCAAQLSAGTLYASDGSEVERGPQPGDCTLCLDCGALLIFDERALLRALNELELLGMDPASRYELLRLREVWKQWVSEGRPGGAN